MEKYCVKCGKKFEAVGREVICPACKQAAAAEAKRAAVLKAKRASWTGESVPVRISGRASTVIRKYAAANGMPFAVALDALLQATAFFRGLGQAWEEVEPYRSHRRDKQDAPQDKQDAPQTVQTVQAAKQAGKVTTSTAAKTAASASKPQAANKAAKTTSKAGKKAGKA